MLFGNDYTLRKRREDTKLQPTAERKTTSESEKNSLTDEMIIGWEIRERI
jgi:hypothetical protein